MALSELRRAVERSFESRPRPGLRRHVLDRFTWAAAGRRTLAAYRKIMALRRRAAGGAPLPEFMVQGFSAGSEIVMGAEGDAQLRLGWGPARQIAASCSRPLEGGRAELFLKGGGTTLRVEGWAPVPARIRVVIDGVALEERPLPADRFHAAWEVPPSDREIREIGVEAYVEKGGESLFVSRAALT